MWSRKSTSDARISPKRAVPTVMNTVLIWFHYLFFLLGMNWAKIIIISYQMQRKVPL